MNKSDEICFWVLFSLIFLSGYICYNIGQDVITQKICSQKQYDFCEVVESKPIYKLKEFKE